MGDIEFHTREMITDVTAAVDVLKRRTGPLWLLPEGEDSRQARELIQTLNGLHANLIAVLQHKNEQGESL